MKIDLRQQQMVNFLNYSPCDRFQKHVLRVSSRYETPSYKYLNI